MDKLTNYTVRRLSQLLRSREISAQELLRAYLGEIEKHESEINAFITLNKSGAAESARRFDEKLKSGEALSPCDGIPMAVKDNLCVRGIKTTCGSNLLRDFVPPYTAGAVEKLSGSVLLGKTNMDEFAMGSTTENSAFKATKNPRNPLRTPGGSSGGSAAAVAAGMAAFALGSDTGGSIRQPAAFCGVVGMKPTYGRVSRYGLVAHASSFDAVGPIAKDVRDCAVVLEAIVGKDAHDATTAECARVDFSERICEGVRGMKIALPKELYEAEQSEDCRAALLCAAKEYERLGAEVTEVSIPYVRYALPAYYVLSSAQAASNLARFDGVRYGKRAADCDKISELYTGTRDAEFGDEVKRRIMLGNFALSAGYYDDYYKKAIDVCRIIKAQFAEVFEKCDLILSPVSPSAAYKLGAKTENPVDMYKGDIFTVPASVIGLPAISLPCGKSKEGMPVGASLIGRAFDEAAIFRAAFALECSVGTGDMLFGQRNTD